MFPLSSVYPHQFTAPSLSLCCLEAYLAKCSYCPVLISQMNIRFVRSAQCWLLNYSLWEQMLPFSGALNLGLSTMSCLAAYSRVITNITWPSNRPLHSVDATQAVMIGTDCLTDWESWLFRVVFKSLFRLYCGWILQMKGWLRPPHIHMEI